MIRPSYLLNLLFVWTASSIMSVTWCNAFVLNKEVASSSAFLTSSSSVHSPFFCRSLPVGRVTATALLSSSSNTRQEESSEAMATEDATSTTTTPSLMRVSGDNVQVTEALHEHVQRRMAQPLRKLQIDPSKASVILSVSRNPKNPLHKIEVMVPVGNVMVVVHRTDQDLYQAIDAASHALFRKLNRYKERRWKKKGKNSSGNSGSAREEDEEVLWEKVVAEQLALTPPEKDVDEQGDPYSEDEFSSTTTVTSVKSFPLDKPMSLEDAMFALDYVDHDFYVFRNEKTNEINVVYKRHVGGVGLVEP